MFRAPLWKDGEKIQLSFSVTSTRQTGVLWCVVMSARCERRIGVESWKHDLEKAWIKMIWTTNLVGYTKRLHSPAVSLDCQEYNQPVLPGKMEIKAAKRQKKNDMSSNFEGSQSPPLMIHKFHHAAFLTWGKVPGSIPRPPYLAPGQPRSGALTGRLDFGVARNTVRMEANLVEGNPTKMEVQSDMPAKTLASNLSVYQV